MSRATVIADIAEWSAYRLVNEAGCFGPDSLDSPGAEFLTRVRNAVLDIDRIDVMGIDELESIDDDGTVHQIADDAPSIYTFTKWQQFTDLGAWQEDIDDWADGITDMDRLASIALYVIAERLANAIIGEITEAARQDDDDDDDDAE